MIGLRRERQARFVIGEKESVGVEPEELLLTKYLKAAITYEGLVRVEHFPVPRAALREAVLNALVHRDYMVPVPIQIRVYDDRLVLWNPATLPDGWTQETLLGPHQSQPPNPDVANAFFRAGEIEAWGRGIERIFQACRDEGVPEPQLTYEANGLWMEFPFARAYLRLIGGDPRELTDSVGDPVSDPVDQVLAQKWGKKWGEKWGETMLEKRLLIARAMLRNPRISTVALAAMMRMATSGIEKHLKVMREDGAIRRVGPAKGGHWEVLS